MSANRFEFCKSFFSNQYQLAKTQVTKLIESDTVKQAKETFNAQYDKIVNSDSVKTCQSGISQIIESENAIRARSVVEGALKTTLGVNYIFDLGLKCIPVTSPAFGAVETIKYAASGTAFAIASYQAYDDLTSHRDSLQNLEVLENEINTANAAFKQLPSTTVAVDSKKLKINVAQPVNTTGLSEIPDSTAFLLFKSFLDAAVQSTVYFYIIDLGFSTLPYVQQVKMVKDILLWTIMLANIIASYARNQSDAEAREKLSILKDKIAPTYNNLIEIEQKIGSKDELKELAKQVESLIHQRIDLNIPEFKAEEVRSRISALSEEEVATYLGALINGAAHASGVHFVIEKTLPAAVTIKYIAAISTLVASACATYMKSKDKLEFQKQLDRLAEKNDEIQDLLTMSNTLASYSIKHGIFREKDSVIPKEISPRDDTCRLHQPS